jgi:murein endopeptidase
MSRVRPLGLAVLLLVLAAAPARAEARPIDYVPPPRTLEPLMNWRVSHAVGRPFAGRLVNGVQLPAQGPDHWTYDWGARVSPNRPWRRWGTDRLVRLVLRVLQEYRLAHPEAARVGVADLSRPHGGPFGREFGGLGHASHQNGLDVDVLYPRLDKLELRAEAPALVDRALAQELVDRFVAAGAVYVFVGPQLHLGGPRKIVTPLRHHDDHMHVRIR